MSKRNLVIIFILVLGAFLRLYQVQSLPALNADEAAIGYNAYSLLETGLDEHGHSWPIHFQSFNDYKPGLYFYLVMPFVKLLGLTENAVRLPNIILSVLTIFILWKLLKFLFPNKKYFPEVAALFLAISPWHIHFSRGGWEANTATFFITAGLYYFVRGTQNYKFWFLAVLSFACSLYDYHAARVVVPLLVFALLVIYRKQILKNLKQFIIAGLFGLLLIIPLGIDLLHSNGLARASGVGLFADLGPFWKTNEQRGEHDDYTSLTAKMLHNRPINYSLAFLQNYGKHFSGEFLFISGDEIERDKVPEMGQMYLLDILFLIVGVLAIFRNFKNWGPIISWLIIAPIAASLTFQSPHALRAENMVVPMITISAFGAVSLWEFVNSNKSLLLVTCYLLLVTGYGWDFTRYLHQYYFHMSKTYDYSSQYGVKELVSFVKDNYDNYSEFAITTRYDQPYVLFLFYLKYPPQKFQSNHYLTSKDEFGFSTVPEFDKFKFEKVDSNPDLFATEHSGALLAVAPGEVPANANVVKTIYFPSGRPAFILIKD